MKTDKLLRVLSRGSQKATGRLLPLPKHQDVGSVGRSAMSNDIDNTYIQKQSNYSPLHYKDEEGVLRFTSNDMPVATGAVGTPLFDPIDIVTAAGTAFTKAPMMAGKFINLAKGYPKSAFIHQAWANFMAPLLVNAGMGGDDPVLPTQKSKRRSLPEHQATGPVKKYDRGINPSTGKPWDPQGIEPSASPLDLIGTVGRIPALVEGTGAMLVNLINRAHPADRGWMQHWTNWAEHDIANTLRNTYYDAKDLYNQEKSKVKKETGGPTNKLLRVLRRHQGTEASQTGTEEPIRTIMDPRYQAGPAVDFAALTAPSPFIRPQESQPALSLNPNWKEGDDPNTKWMINLPEVEGESLYSFPTCVGGLCYDMASDLGQGVEEFKKRNNVIGNAWDIINTAFGENVDYNPKDFTNLKIGDVVALTRGKRATDAERGITSESEQHMGRISKIVDGVPYVKHYMPGIEGKGTKDKMEKSYGRYLEEPINDISEVTSYTPSRVKRLPDYKELNLQPSNFGFDKNYKPNQIEQQMLTAMKEKPFLQETLALDTDEYDNLEKLAYGILYNEGNFGRSGKTLYRMAVPDFVQKLVKQGQDAYRGTNVYDENVNNLSQGYASLKESTLHGVSQSDLKADKSNKLSSEEVNRRVKQGDYSNLERTNNYLYETMREMGLNTDNLENGGNSFKAVMATLAWYKRRFPNATNDELMQKFLGKKNITKYKANMENAYRNIDRNPSNDQEYSFLDQVYGTASGAANTVYEGLKDLRSNVVSTARDYSGAPLMVRSLLGDVLGGKEPITNTTLNSEQLSALTDIVRNQVESGKNYLDYNAYFPELSRQERLGVSGGLGDQGDNTSTIDKLQRALSAQGQLQNTFGQAAIVPLGDGKYMVTDTYDFNDQGKSFGLMDDLIKRGASPYAIARSIGRNYGSMDEQGAPVNIVIDLNQKRDGGSYMSNKTLKVRIKKPK